MSILNLEFTKMHGCGNDYIFVDGITPASSGFALDTTLSPVALEALAIRLADRHTGVGADGLVLMLPSNSADARMRMFNSDGSEGKMCGNAIRCVAKYLFENSIVSRTQMRIETLSGVRELWLTVCGDKVTSVKVDMGKPLLLAEEIPVLLDDERVVARPIEMDGTMYAMTCVSMGNPHAVLFGHGIDALDLTRIGPQFEHHPLFPQRVNTEFVEVVGKNRLQMRVWERGSGETQACGTGACAAVVAATLNGYCEPGADVIVQLLGGELVLNYTDNRVIMSGNCITVFMGCIEVYREDA